MGPRRVKVDAGKAGPDMDIKIAQEELRASFAGGGMGAITSGVVWLVAGLVVARAGIVAGFAALFVGGIFIFPVSTFLCRTGLRRPAPSAENSLGMVALESTIAMLGMFFAAFLFLEPRPQLVLPLAAIAVGTHYFAFRTAYGDVAFWILGGVVTLVGAAGIFGYLGPYAPTAYAVAATELVAGLGLVLFRGRASATA